MDGGPLGKHVRARVGRLATHPWIEAAFAVVLALLLSQAAIAADPIARIRTHGIVYVGDTALIESIGQNDPKAHFQWKLDQRPKNSKAKIDDRNSAQTSFQADVAGVYVVSFTVKLRNASATATVQMNIADAPPNASPLPPLINVNTIAFDAQGNLGMTVGDAFYKDGANPGPCAGQGTGLHVVVLNRDDLTPKENYSVALSQNAIQNRISASPPGRLEAIRPEMRRTR